MRKRNTRGTCFTLPEVEHEKPIVSVTRKVENEELVVQSTDPKM